MKLTPFARIFCCPIFPLCAPSSLRGSFRSSFPTPPRSRRLTRPSAPRPPCSMTWMPWLVLLAAAGPRPTPSRLRWLLTVGLLALSGVSYSGSKRSCSCGMALVSSHDVRGLNRWCEELWVLGSAHERAMPTVFEPVGVDLLVLAHLSPVPASCFYILVALWCRRRPRAQEEEVDQPQQLLQPQLYLEVNRFLERGFKGSVPHGCQDSRRSALRCSAVAFGGCIMHHAALQAQNPAHAVVWGLGARLA